MMTKLATVIASGGFVGRVPIMPGTAASLLTAFILFFLPPFSWAGILTVSLSLFTLGWWSINVCLQDMVDQDPPWIVIDEVIGMAIALCAVPPQYITYSVAFILFRCLDICKPFPINIIDKKIPGAWGVLLDDVVAGCVARLIIIFLL